MYSGTRRSAALFIPTTRHLSDGSEPRSIGSEVTWLTVRWAMRASVQGAAQATLCQPDSESASQPPMSQQARDLAPWHIVATDDDPKLLSQVTYALRDAGHIVYAAYNGFIALQQATSIPDLDLLITNTRLRGLNAAELIRRVREVRPGLPILHIGDPLPVDEHTRNVPTLREPVTGEALLEEIAALLGR